jgi:hypothetical protein
VERNLLYVKIVGKLTDGVQSLLDIREFMLTKSLPNVVKVRKSPDTLVLLSNLLRIRAHKSDKHLKVFPESFLILEKLYIVLPAYFYHFLSFD